MTYRYDTVLTNLYLVDPASGHDGEASIAIAGGRVAAVASSNSVEGLEGQGREIIDCEGLTAVPGLIDLHTHLTPSVGGSAGGFHMLAKAGICTALDLAGPAREFFPTMAANGSGISVATLEAVMPGENVSGASASRGELDDFVSRSLDAGSLGVKLMGGHFPLTPESSREFVAAAAAQGAYCSWHAGSTESCNTTVSLREVLDSAAGNFIHVPHINSYCRGMTKPWQEEVREAFDLLSAHPNAYSEAYLSESNGTNFVFNEEGKMKSNSTGRILEYHGFENSPEGLEKAIRAGFARVTIPRGLETVPIYGEDAVAYWNEHGRDTTGGFNVNPPLPRIALCVEKTGDGDFCIDAISTDGGAIPRNAIVSHGLALVALGALSLSDFVRKASYNPSRILGLKDKGSLSVGADADVTLLDVSARRPVMTMSGGVVCMYKGMVTASGGTVITTKRGEAAVLGHGLRTYVADPGKGPLPFRKHQA